VLFVLASLAGGGAERTVAHLVGHIDPHKFDARVGVLWRSGPYLQDVGQNQLVTASRMQGWIPYRDRPPWWQLLPSLAVVPLQQREIMQRFRPDIVVTATKSMNLAARAALAMYGRRHVAWIVREGNNTGAMLDNEAATGVTRHFQNVAIRACYRQADAVVAISDGVASGLTTRFHLDPTRVRTIHNAADVERIRARAGVAPASAPDGPFVVAAGRLDHQKGFDVLLRAFTSRIAMRGWSLVILGEGTERQRLEALARTLGVADRVRLPGFVDNPWAYFARASLFVCSSRWEGFGNVIIEALACGVPVVATDCDFGPREILRHGDTGWLVRVGDADALGHAMEQLLDNPARAAQLASAGARRAEDFSVHAMARAYERLFRDVLDHRRRRDRTHEPKRLSTSTLTSC